MKGKPGKTVRTGYGDEAARVTIDPGLCTGCGLCARVCKSFILVMRDFQVRIEPDKGLGCIGCGQCMAVCPSGAVRVTGRRLKPEHIFRLAPASARATPEALENLLLARRSVREFKPENLKRELIARILQIAAAAPMGIPPSDVGVVAVNGLARVQELAADITEIFAKWQRIFKPFTMTLLRPFVKKSDIESLRDFVLPVTAEMIAARAEGIDYLFYHAPCVLLFHQSPYADPVDGQIACTYAMLAAESLGLGSCMIGTISFALNHDQKARNKWGIPAANKVALALILGKPDIKYLNGIQRSFASIAWR